MSAKGGREAERLGGLQVDNQREFGRLLNGQVGRVSAPEDVVKIHGARNERLWHGRISDRDRCEQSRNKVDPARTARVILVGEKSAS